MRTVAQKQNQPQQKSANLTRSNMRSSATPQESHPLLQLQRSIGNQAVLRLLRARADRLEAQEHSRLQTKHVGPSDAGPIAAPPIVNEVLASTGQPLDASTRAFFEPRFGHDFSKVQVHSGPIAEQSTRDVNSKAYTVGNDIVFGAGAFNPQTQDGRRLMGHELTHVVQQSGANGSLANQGQAKLDRTVAVTTQQRVLQRDMGFEFQTKNLILGDKGRPFPGKLGGFLHKVPPTDKNGLELQTEVGSVAEFETHHFRKWSDLQVQIQNAVDVVNEIKKDPKAFPFNQAKRLEKEGLLKKGENLEVVVKDSAFVAAIQSTEGFGLAQYESALKEHEKALFVGPVISGAQNILTAASTANPKISSSAKLDNLRAFLQVILNYILNAQTTPSTIKRVSPVKARFSLMSRTKFSAMFKSALTPDEQTLFRDIVKSGAIPKELGLTGTEQFFPQGYWGHIEGMWALFQGGKVVALAPEPKKPIHDCSTKTKAPLGVDASKCGSKVKDTEITIGGWLASIVKAKADAISPPPRGGSGSMGQFDVQAAGPEKGLVVFETRAESGRNRNQPADKWVEFAEDIFRQAAVCRERAGTGTELIYDGSKKPLIKRRAHRRDVLEKQIYTEIIRLSQSVIGFLHTLLFHAREFVAHL